MAQLGGDTMRLLCSRSMALGGDTMGLTLRRLGRLMTVGFRGPRSRPMKRLVIVQWLIAATLLLIWFQFNGGKLL